MKVKFFNSIQTKLSMISLVMLAFVLILLSCIYVYKDYSNYNSEMSLSLTQTASLVGDSSLASLLFDDPDSAKEILALLKSQKRIVAAGILDKKNQIFAQYTRKDISTKQAEFSSLIQKQLKHHQPYSLKESGQYAVFIKYISYQKKISGQIYLIYDMADRKAKLIQSILLMMMVFLSSMFLIFVSSFFLQRSIFKPLKSLVEIMQEISVSKKFTVNIQKTNNKDEVAWLINGFYEMLKQIRKQDDSLKDKNKELKHLAYHDPLTDLPNFLLFKEVVTHALNNRSIKKFSILFIDLDNFKSINDTFGHSAGDSLLKTVAAKFNTLLRVSDYTAINNSVLNTNSDGSIARIGGDEFIIMLEDIGENYNIDKIIQRMFRHFEEPVLIEGVEVYIKLSIGISIYPDDASKVDKLIKYADTAMYQVKGTGKNNYGYFNKSHHLAVKRKLLLEQDMLHGIERDEFKLYYQPKINIVSNTIDGFEVLLRWEHPTLGMISPGEFIPIAEMSRFIIKLGEWVIKESCKQLRCWLDMLPLKFSFAINLSPLQFKSKALFDCINNALINNHLEPGAVELEITEGILMEDHELSFAVIDKLSKMGVDFSIDDFGTGYSSFQYLSRFNAHVIKIDKIFIDNIDTHKENQVISNSIIALAHNMGMKVVAEGVETIEQLNYLKNINCDIIQGYYFSKPLPAEKLKDFFTPYLSK